jgi:formamidopyrimidine-DNA glycosylase
MPELPEVETIARQLAPLLSGRRVERAEILDPKLTFKPDALAGSVVERVMRLGKRLVLEILGKKGSRFLRFDLRMTGRLTWSSAGQDFSPKHLRAVFTLAGGNLLFYDPRRFGTIEIFANLRDAGPTGVEPLDPGLSPEKLRGLFAGSRQALKIWLLRQDRLSGIGNIYASEVPFAAGLSPLRPVNELSREETETLRDALRSVLGEAVKNRGTTLSDYRDARGARGAHQGHLKVYRRGNETCTRCGGRIERIVLRGRSTFFCPGCQF